MNFDNFRYDLWNRDDSETEIVLILKLLWFQSDHWHREAEFKNKPCTNSDHFHNDFSLPKIDTLKHGVVNFCYENRPCQRCNESTFSRVRVLHVSSRVRILLGRTRVRVQQVSSPSPSPGACGSSPNPSPKKRTFLSSSTKASSTTP